jgi:hypothetical protein
MPALRAKSESTWIGLWSPEAPQYSASVKRDKAGKVMGGIASPTAKS